MAFFQKSSPVLVSAYNNAVGFEQIGDTDLDNQSLEEWTSTHLNDVKMEELDFTDYHDLFNQLNLKNSIILLMVENNFGIISVARGFIYDISNDNPIPLTMDHLQTYTILSGLKILFLEMNPETFVQEFDNLYHRTNKLYGREPPMQHLVAFQNFTIFLILSRLGNRIKMTLPGNENCLYVRFEMANKNDKIKFEKTIVSSLFFHVKKSECYGIESYQAGIGSWFLNLIDKLNELLQIKYCELTDASSFEENGKQISASCAYSRLHNGLTFYMSRGFLVNDHEDLIDSINRTNKIITRINDWWNNTQNRFDESIILSSKCQNFISFHNHMIKFYPNRVQINIPQNKTNPARFEWKPTHLFQCFLAKDIRHIWNFEETIITNDTLVQKIGFPGNCQFTIIEPKNIVLNDITLELLTNSKLDTSFWRIYYSQLFPILKDCHEKINARQFFMNKHTHKLEDQCERITNLGISCLNRYEKNLQVNQECSKFCKIHYRESIEKFVESLQLLSITSDIENMEMVASPLNYKIVNPSTDTGVDIDDQETQLFDYSQVEKVIQYLQTLSTGSDIDLIVKYEFTLSLEKETMFHIYYKQHQIEIVPEDWIWNKNILTIYFSIQT